MSARSARNGLCGCARALPGPMPPARGELRHQETWAWVGLNRHPLTAPTARLLSLAESENLVCAFYGELFDRGSLVSGNATDLRADHSNAEIVLELFRERHHALWPALNGSFVLALLNRQDRSVSVVNDRFASIPLFYGQTETGFVFSTGVDDTARLFPGPLSLNEASVFSFITYQRVFGAATFYEEISALLPASSITFETGKLSHRCYFEARYQAANRTPDEWTERLAEAWAHSVRERTEDSPVMLLSGGLDSRAVLAARSELPSVILADFENNEVKTARNVAALTGSTFEVLFREPDHYARLLDEATAVGGGMYPAHMAHVPGCCESFAARAPAVIHGNPPEAYFRNSSLFREHGKTLPAQAGTDIVDRLLAQFRAHGKYNMTGSQPWEVLTDAARTSYTRHETQIRPLFEEAVACCETVQDMYTWVDTRYMARYPSYVFELALASALPKRTATWDNALYDLHMEMPWQIRDGDALWLAMIRRLNPRLAELPSANKRLVAFPALPKVAQRAVLQGLALARRLRLLPSALPSDPTYTLGSWPNFDELLRRCVPLRTRFSQALSDLEGLPPSLFDHEAVRRRFQQHLAGKRDDAYFLFALVTFSLWHRGSALGETREDNRSAWGNEL